MLRHLVEALLESGKPWVEGFVVREITPLHSNWRATESLDAFLGRHGVVGISGADTRALTRHLRSRGAMKGVISSVDLDPASLQRKAQDAPGLVGRDLVREVTCAASHRPDYPGEKRFRVAAIDCGMKKSILDCLASTGCDLTVFPPRPPPVEPPGLPPGSPSGALKKPRSSSPTPGSPAQTGDTRPTPMKNARAATIQSPRGA